MKPTSLKLCKELYELSGGHDSDELYLDDFYRNKDGDIIAPKYTLGYLLQKLPAQSSVNMMYTKGAEATYMQKKPWIRVTANTPEDALCKLAIELFKKGILKREES